MAGSWRKYTFFDKDIVNENIETILGSKVSYSTADSGMLLFGCENGSITLTHRDFSSVNSTNNSLDNNRVFRGLIYGLAYLFDSKNQNRQYVIAIGDDNPNMNIKSDDQNNQLSSYIQIKILWASDMTRPINSFYGGYSGIPSSAKVTAFVVSPDGTQIAVGFSNGAVILFNGTFLKDIGSNKAPSPQILLTEHTAPVSAIYFCDLRFNKVNNITSPSATSNNEIQMRLFVVFDTSIPSTPSTTISSDIELGGIMTYDVSIIVTSTGSVIPSNHRKPVNILDDRGAAKLCSTYVKDTRELVVAREEGVFSYSVEDRGGAAGFEGIKQCVCAVGRYILVGSLDEKTYRNNIAIYDLKNKFISFSGQIAAGEKILSVMNDGGIAYLLTSSHMLIRYRERDTSSKVEVLLKKSLYPLAISLITEEQSDVNEISKLIKMYGDYLYKKGDYDGAIQQYIQTIGFLQSSYVIRLYLDPHRIYNLISYLEKILERGLANKEHKTLLITCYTKIKDEEKIQLFLQQITNPSISTNLSNASTLPLGLTRSESTNSVDAGACIEILTQTGFIDAALYLAAWFSQHDLYLSLQVDQGVSGMDSALAYLTSLSLALPQGVYLPYLLSTLPKIIDSKPMQVTGLLTKLCSGDFQGLKSSLQGITGPLSTHLNCNKGDYPIVSFSSLPIEDITLIFINHEEFLLLLIENVYNNNNISKNVNVMFSRNIPTKVINTLIELYLSIYSKHKLDNNVVTKLDSIADSKVNKSNSNIDGKIDSNILNSLLSNIETKIYNLLDNHSLEYDYDRILLLCYQYNYEIGYRYLLDKSNSTYLLLRLYYESNDNKGIFKILKKEGIIDNSLIIQILTYFVKKSINDSAISDNDIDDDDRWEDIEEIIEFIEKQNILTPAQVLSVLSLNPDLPFHLISRFIIRNIEEVEEKNEILLHDVNSMRQTISSILVEQQAKKQLTTKSNENKPKKNKAINKSKDLVNQRKQAVIMKSTTNHDEENSDDDDDAELQRYEKLNEQKKWELIKKGMIDRSLDHEIFYKELEGSNNGFSLIANYFGKSIIFDGTTSEKLYINR